MKKALALFILFFILNFQFTYAQTFTGFIQTPKGEPIAYANIGVVKKGIGTTSNEKGQYVLALNALYGNDSLRVSCIGYASYSIKVSEFMAKQPKVITLKEAKYAINDVVIKRSHFKDRILGYTCESKLIQGGFTNNNLGYELGVLLKVKTRAKIERINLNIGNCTYDSVMYRVNVYQQKGDLEFVNILTKPICIKFSKKMTNNTLSYDISAENIWINGNGLIAIEHVRNMGKGQLTFCCAFPGKTYHRKASQGLWEIAPIAAGLFVNAKVE